MYSLAPLIARVGARLGVLGLIGAASEQVELAPGEQRGRPPAFALPGEFERATGFYEDRAMERARVEGGIYTDGATIAYRIENALVAGGAVYKGMRAEFYRRDGPRILLSGSVGQRTSGLMTTTVVAERYFGDWLLQSFTAALLSERLGAPPIGFLRKEWPHEAGYRDLVGLPIEAIGQARFKSLWLMDDRGMNGDRAARFAVVRDSVRSRAPMAAGPHKVFLTRGRLGRGRSLANEREVRARLEARGYVVIEPENLTPAAVVAVLKDAEIIITVEGSAQTHALIASPARATLVILQPPTRFTAPGKDWADLVAMRYAYLVGDPAGGADRFSIDLPRLDALLSLVETKYE